MAFLNLQVDTDELPRAATLEWEPMAPAHKREVLTQAVITWGLLLLVATVLPLLLVPATAVLRNYIVLIPLLVALPALFVIPLLLKRLRCKAVALREHDIAYRSGLYWRKTVMLAFNRVQHVEVSTGPLQRRFGLATLKFFTAGGSSVDLKIDGLTRERAEQLRTFILQKSTHHEDG